MCIYNQRKIYYIFFIKLFKKYFIIEDNQIKNEIKKYLQVKKIAKHYIII